MTTWICIVSKKYGYRFVVDTEINIFIIYLYKLKKVTSNITCLGNRHILYLLNLAK